MTITIHRQLVQGSEEWVAARRGLITASEIKLIMTPTLKPARNDKERAHLYELLAQRITGHVEPHYVGDDMLRGREDEIEARALYAKRYKPVQEVGFITRDFGSFTMGYSPDGLVGRDGLIECKGRRARFQVETIISGEVPQEHVLQCQAGLLVSGRKWLDFVSYSGGLPMVTIRVKPDVAIQEAIMQTAGDFEGRLAVARAEYEAKLKSKARLLPTERRVEPEMFL